MKTIAGLFLGILFLIPMTSLAQADGDAKIGGQIVDTTGVPLDEVEVSLKGLRLGGIYRSTDSDHNGSFTIDRMEPGWYWLEASGKGYGRYKVRIRLDGGARVRHDITLQNLHEFAASIEESKIAGFGLREGLVLASQAVEQKDWLQAAKLLDQIRDLGRWDADFQELDGRQKAAQDSCEDAGKAFSAAKKIRKGRLGFRAQASWAECLERKGDLGQAKTLWQDVLSEQPYLWQARLALSELLVREGKPEKARVNLTEKDGTLHPSAPPEAGWLLANLLQNMGDGIGAVHLLEAVLAAGGLPDLQKQSWQAQLSAWREGLAQSGASIQDPKNED